MAEIIVENKEQVATLTLKAGASVKAGDLLGYNTGWVKADASVGGIYFAQWIACQGGNGSGEMQSWSDVIEVCKSATLYDADAPYTANTTSYLSTTAGAITETRPSRGVGNLVQVVGRSIDTYRTLVRLKMPEEFTLWCPAAVYDGTGEPGIGTADTGWTGPQVDAATEVTYYNGRLPEGLVGSVLVARHIINSINASAADLDYSIVGSYDGTAAAAAANNQDTGTAITATDFEQADADDKILTVDVSALFDSGFYLPGRTFSILCDPDGMTGDAHMLGIVIVGLCV